MSSKESDLLSFFVTKGMGPYGPRVFIPRATFRMDDSEAGPLRMAARYLKQWSVWGGHDKVWKYDGKEWIGFEAKSDVGIEVARMVLKADFAEIEIDPKKF